MFGFNAGGNVRRIAVLIIVLLALASSAPRAGDWTDKIDIGGDFRYRYDFVDDEELFQRHRQRIRMRLNVSAEVTNGINAVFQIASGTESPVSANQTLTDGFSSKEVQLNRAYVEGERPEIPGLAISAGKFKCPWFKPGNVELVWDANLNTEGIVATYSRSSEDVNLRIMASGQIIEERSADEDSYLAGLQAIGNYDMTLSSSLTLAASYYDYANTEGHPTFWKPELALGNTLDFRGGYANDFNLLEFSGEVQFESDGIPFAIHGDFVSNTAADSDHTGWLIGMRAGNMTRQRGTWTVQYNYRKLEKDAVVGLFTDSVFRGAGTDGKGHKVWANLMIFDNTMIGIKYFNNKKGLDNGSNLQRVIVDLSMNF